MTARADYITEDDITVGDEWGEIFSLDRIDDLSVKVAGNPVDVRFSPILESGGYHWRKGSKLFAGGWNDITDGAAKGFGHFQFRNTAAGSPGVVSIRAYCHGG
jgi:hypothetical protein